MIVQACINGARPEGYHPQLPLSIEAMIRDSRACIAAGAAELHIHPRDAGGRESLAAVDALMPPLRRACRGTLIGVSTGAWIEGDADATRARIAAWGVLPDYASVNLAEADAPAVMALLTEKGVGIEAGLATVADAKRLVSLPAPERVFRVLIEIEEQDPTAADRIADGILAVLDGAGLHCPRLLHGFDATVWHFIRRARDGAFSTRVGLEDGCLRPDGQVTAGNAELVAAAVAIMRDPAGSAQIG
ncbi:3-keto-5-aminohexanoate cleavage protein [Paracoccus sp. S1E-3]|uniref:3-keto-5-aminohexanoate cleavage protein n=1 Tax=Paracoccus sp. S1E-3 TaxID=2756130 RepID=UPI0015EFC49B|nr:3-keto-5-aminohexanoate cleavage protein [Paracoccus sp. S1E-3]MBA4489499.1 3-keto-5-aminohexanoate cleavage protein [Paracoccus sp. S1E-3]